MTEDAVNLKAEVEFWKAKAYEAEDREGKLEAEVERLKEQLSDSRDDLMRTQIEMQLEIDRGEAEVEKLEVEYWFMEEALTKEIEALKEEIK
jgi:septal ring factor EnvC (AmiA/AmiB activator)